jgi:NitT/TauT family transport system substrate-binding protein
LRNFPGICLAPQFIAEPLLRAEGFTDIRYVNPSQVGTVFAVARDELDIDSNTPWTLITAIDARDPITVLAGVMVGCYELLANENIRSIADLKGVAWASRLLGLLGWVSLLAGHPCRARPENDIHWITDPDAKPLELFVQARSMPSSVSQELRACSAGHVIVNTALDRPWSQYFCCMLVGNREFVRKNPIATKRAVRAILKGDRSLRQRTPALQAIVDRGFANGYDPLLQTLKDNPYKWRDYNAEDTIRFYALRLHDVGLLKSDPNKIIADGTDWRSLNELKRELKV